MTDYDDDMKTCKQEVAPESFQRYTINRCKVALYQAILDLDYRQLTDNEVEIGFLLAKDDFIRGLINEAINKERSEQRTIAEFERIIEQNKTPFPKSADTNLKSPPSHVHIEPPGPPDYPKPKGYNPKG